MKQTKESCACRRHLTRFLFIAAALTGAIVLSMTAGLAGAADSIKFSEQTKPEMKIEVKEDKIPGIVNVSRLTGRIYGSADGKNVAELFGSPQNLTLSVLDPDNNEVAKIKASPGSSSGVFTYSYPTFDLHRYHIRAQSNFNGRLLIWKYIGELPESGNYASEGERIIDIKLTGSIQMAAKANQLSVSRKSPLGDLAVKADIKLFDASAHWFLHDPDNPSKAASDDPVTVIAKAINHGGSPGIQNIYMRATVLSGGPLPAGVVGSGGQLLSYQEIALAPDESGEVYFAHSKQFPAGSYRFEASTSSTFSDNLVSTELTVMAADNRPILAVISPTKMEAGYDKNKFTITGKRLLRKDKYDHHVAIPFYFQKTNGGTKLPAGINNFTMNSVTGYLPSYVANNPGDYKVWGEILGSSNQVLASNQLSFSVPPLSSDPPRIDSYTPEIITNQVWNVDGYSSYGQGFTVLGYIAYISFVGDGFNHTTKVDAQISPSLKTRGGFWFKSKSGSNGNDLREFPHKLSMELRLADKDRGLPTEPGWIDFRFYNDESNPGNCSSVRIPVIPQVPTIEAPTIVEPYENQLFESQAVRIYLEAGSGAPTRQFVLEWEYKLPGSGPNQGWAPAGMLSSLNEDASGSQNGIELPFSKFAAMEGKWRFRAWSKTASGSLVEAKKSNWRTINIKSLSTPELAREAKAAMITWFQDKGSKFYSNDAVLKLKPELKKKTVKVKDNSMASVLVSEYPLPFPCYRSTHNYYFEQRYNELYQNAPAQLLKAENKYDSAYIEQVNRVKSVVSQLNNSSVGAESGLPCSFEISDIDKLCVVTGNKECVAAADETGLASGFNLSEEIGCGGDIDGVGTPVIRCSLGKVVQDSVKNKIDRLKTKAAPDLIVDGLRPGPLDEKIISPKAMTGGQALQYDSSKLKLKQQSLTEKVAAPGQAKVMSGTVSGQPVHGPSPVHSVLPARIEVMTVKSGKVNIPMRFQLKNVTGKDVDFELESRLSPRGPYRADKERYMERFTKSGDLSTLLLNIGKAGDYRIRFFTPESKQWTDWYEFEIKGDDKPTRKQVMINPQPEPPGIPAAKNLRQSVKPPTIKEEKRGQRYIISSDRTTLSFVVSHESGQDFDVEIEQRNGGSYTKYNKSKAKIRKGSDQSKVDLTIFNAGDFRVRAGERSGHWSQWLNFAVEERAVKKTTPAIRETRPKTISPSIKPGLKPVP